MTGLMLVCVCGFIVAVVVVAMSLDRIDRVDICECCEDATTGHIEVRFRCADLAPGNLALDMGLLLPTSTGAHSSACQVRSVPTDRAPRPRKVVQRIGTVVRILAAQLYGCVCVW